MASLKWLLLLLTYGTYPSEGLQEDGLDLTKVKVVVIGAGAAGLAATQRLLDGQFDVTLLEASDRIGGRIWTVSTDKGSNVELGAEWLEGGDEFLKWAFDKGYLANLTVRPPEEGLFLVQNRPNMTFSQTEKDVAWTTMLKTDLPELAGAYFDTSANQRDLSMGSLLWNKYINWRHRSVLPNISDAVYDYIIRKEKANSATDNLYDLGSGQAVRLSPLISERSIKRSLQQNISFSTLLSSFAPKALSVLRSNMWVTSIKLNKASANYSLQVTTNSDVTFSADHVIMTTSLGHLKTNLHTLFNPPLSERKQRVIAAAGFGTLGKIVLVYEEAWWRHISPALGAGSFLYLNSKAVDMQRLYEMDSWTRGLSGFQETEKVPNSLSLLFGGPQAGQTDNLTEAQIGRDFTQLLQTFFHNETLPLPKTVYRAKWKKNPLFGGTHTYFSTAFQQNNYTIDDLALPDAQFGYKKYLKGRMRLIPGLLFAGEATHAKLFSTVEGAILSGIREANRLSIIYA